MDHPAPYRRSNPPKLSSLKPLQTMFTSFDESEPTVWPTTTANTSYISGRSAPTTPGILSRNSSTHHFKSSHRSSTRLAFSDLTASRGLIRSKSTSMLVLRENIDMTATREKARKQRNPKIKTTMANDDGEWLLRAGLAITGETRDNKGQSWLASRASSTSLALALDDDEDSEIIGLSESTADFTTTNLYASQREQRYSRSNSYSARQSRRGSKVGSRSELSFFTPVSARTPMQHDFLEDEDGDYFGEAARMAAGPDFVDGDELDEVDEAQLDEMEIASLTKEQGFGLGSFVDRLVGWSLFDIGDEKDLEGSVEATRESPWPLNAQHSNSNKLNASKAQPTRSTIPGEQRPNEAGGPEADQGGWNDVAWLLSVASKVLL